MACVELVTGKLAVDAVAVDVEVEVDREVDELGVDSCELGGALLPRAGGSTIWGTLLDCATESALAEGFAGAELSTLGRVTLGGC